MSVCSPCLQVCRVPICTSEIILGSISSVSTDVKIIIENKTKGGKKIVSTQSDGAGLVTLVTADLGLMADQTYEISVILASATALCDTETLTIGSSTASCVSVIFENIKDENNCQVTFESQTLAAIVAGENANVECCWLETLEGTYAQIVAALTAGIDTEKYSHVLITDFQTIYDQPDYDNTGTAKGVVVTKTSAVTEPLLIALLDANTLQAEAHSALYPKDQIRYDISFSQTEVMATAAKGRITERIDHLNNRTDYDHRHVVFKRYESVPASGIFNQYKDNGGASQEFTTFQFAQEIIDGFPGGFSNNNFIGDYAILFVPYGNPFLLSNNVFGKNAEDNKTPQYTVNNTWGETANSNVFTNDISGCVFGINFTGNRFTGLYDLVFGNNCSSNIFSGPISGSTFGNQFSNNIGCLIALSTFGNNSGENNFGTVIAFIIATDDFQNNSFLNVMSGIDFTGATHVYFPYHCSIFANAALVPRLSYFDAADVLTVITPTA